MISRRDWMKQGAVAADIELIRADEINGAYKRLLKGDVKYRFVIDTATLAARNAAHLETLP
ncbi:MAG TPA: hypothetical protein VH518_08550 [Tepidisphaeraceae bacterium]